MLRNPDAKVSEEDKIGMTSGRAGSNEETLPRDHNGDSIQHLRVLRKKAALLNATLLADLKPFFEPNFLVFRRLPPGDPDSDVKGNVTNTCSCLMSLATADKLIDFFKDALDTKSDDVAKKRITKLFRSAVESEWTSSGLPDDNAFTSLIVLRTAGLLSKCTEKPFSGELALEMAHTPRIPSRDKLIKKRPAKTLRELLIGFGDGAPNSFGVGVYPSTPGIAYWFVDALDNLIPGKAKEFFDQITTWASQNFARQVSLVAASHEALKDPVAMALAACLATRLRRIILNQAFKDRDTMLRRLPASIEVEQAVLHALAFQETTGIWPKYFPLFNYRKGAAGSNHLFSFEVLEVIVSEFQDSTLLEAPGVLRGIQRALDWCQANRLRYRQNRIDYEGWNSGGQITTLQEGKPEAWATAMVHMFLRKLQLGLSLLIKKRCLQKYGLEVSTTYKKDRRKWDEYIDTRIRLRDGEETTVKNLIQAEILDYILSQKDDVLGRGKMKHRRSALLFGPPGTSKTSLVRAISKMAGWPLVEIGPSDFLKQGLDQIYSQANEIFEDLGDLWQAVIFFDEMDALAQKREEGIDVTRQFLTTSMLPKLATLHDAGRVLFFMATNHQRQFDDAIKRPGRFDLLICMGPPQWVEKLKPSYFRQFLTDKQFITPEEERDIEFVRKRLEKWVPTGDKLVETLDLFTFNEFKSLLESIGKAGTLRSAIKDMKRTEFRKKVQDWGENLIALREWKRADIVKPDLSLREEFDLDQPVSAKQ
jgi:hypothetical protein